MTYELTARDIDVMFFGLEEKTQRKIDGMNYKDHIRENPKQADMSDYGGDTSRFINETIHTNHRF